MRKRKGKRDTLTCAIPEPIKPPPITVTCLIADSTAALVAIPRRIIADAIISMRIFQFLVSN